ncbi:MAG TPA: TolC family protein [Holophaga sp.]|nr:TolC family protein [Holophaga sp.]
MLRITPKEKDGRLTLVLEGKLSGPWVAELAQAWSERRAGTDPRRATIDLRAVAFVDDGGRALLEDLHREGLDLVGSGCYVGPIVQSILHAGEAGVARLRFLWLPLAATAVAGTLAAAEPPLRLSMAEALKQGLSRNPEIQKSLLAVAQAQEDRRMAAGALMPSVGAGAGLTRMKENFDILLGTPTPHGPNVVGPFNAGQVGVEAQAPLFDLSLYKRWKASREGEASSQAQGRVVREQIAALIVGQYLRSQRAAEARKAAASRVELARALETLAENQQKNGLGTKLDTLRAQVALQAERQRLIQAETQWRTAQYGLVKLMDLAPGTALELTDPLTAPEIPAFTFQEAYGKGLAQRSEMAALDARERAAKELQGAARSLRLPTLVATGSYSSTGLYPGQPWVPVYTLGVGLKVPLFTGGRVSAQVAKAKTELARVEEERKELRGQVGYEVQVAQAELESARNEVEVTGAAVAFAEEAMTQARHRFEAGVSNNIEVTAAQDDLAKATDNRINALHRLNQARADLARAMGQLEPLFAH